MLKLAGKMVTTRNLADIPQENILRLAADPNLSAEERSKSGLLIGSSEVPEGFAAYVVFEQQYLLDLLRPDIPIVVLPEEYSYLAAGDVVRLQPRINKIRVLYRRQSHHNSFLVTERCDNYCLMCSQPPKAVDDSWIIDEILQVIPLIGPDTAQIGFTGGEPTLLGDRFIDVLHACKRYLPKTAVHVLSNGRRFSDALYAKQWANVVHPDLMVGIPLYSDVSTIHDYVVQADGAYDETVRGILNLKQLAQRVELRVVLHRQTYGNLPRLAEFIARNLLFVDHVALMGLEIMGFTRANLDVLWIDPIEYQNELYEAVRILDASGLKVSIYNHQLCLLDRRLWPFAVKSISDWKNEYVEECSVCRVKEQCGGFFSSAKYKRSANIAPILE